MSLALRSLRAAFAFLTRIPVGGHPHGRDAILWSTSFFPLVGAALGVLLGLLFLGLRPLGDVSAAWLVLGASMLLTGAFHEDGLADTADALGGGYTRERVLQILKDSRVGAFGAGALVVSLAVRAGLLARLGAAAPWALVLSQCVARTPPIWLMGALPYVTRDEAAKSRDVARATMSQVGLASLWPSVLLTLAVAAGAISLPRALAIVAALAAVAVGCGSRFRARVGGLTGDFLGATEQIAEIAVLGVLAWR